MRAHVAEGLSVKHMEGDSTPCCGIKLLLLLRLLTAVRGCWMGEEALTSAHEGWVSGCACWVAGSAQGVRMLLLV